MKPPMKVPAHIKCAAEFSDDTLGPDGRGRYRFTLWRRNLLDDDPGAFKLYQDEYVQYVCLNPSTADENFDDPTVRSCWKRSRAMGYGAFVMTNIFAFRATDPAIMRQAADPVGEWNDEYLDSVAAGAGCIVLGWGSHGTHQNRDTAVLRLLERHLDKLYYLDINDAGHAPKHPLYQPDALRPKPVGKLMSNFLRRSHI